MQQDNLDLAGENNDDFERIPCEICGSNDHYLIASRTDLFLGGDTKFAMHECAECGAIYQFPRPTPQKMADFYPSEYQQYTKGLAEDKWLTRLSRRYGLRKRAQVITNQVSTGKVLDVGCATGDFLSVMRTFEGWDVFGIEPSHSPLKYAREKVGLSVVEGILNVAPFAENSFDAITMWDVLEHVYNPPEVLADVARLLKPGGVFVVNHPNVDSIDRKVFKDMWLGYELPRHLYLFPGELLKGMMAELGFTEVARTCLYGSHAATFSSLMFLVEKRFKNPKIHRLARRMLFNVGARVIFLPYFKVIDYLNKGSNITAVFVKAT
ncbi:MAG: class I SAM-dependent methyltransferase [Anaerolineales bacterium]|nr:class I SAM-dependent methyltransferase [Anaerolineales bacterium]